MTIAELAKALGLSTRSIERHLQKLVKRGSVTSYKPAKGRLLECGKVIVILAL
ncbi:MAG: winged helix-turn-helix transcriptional regulator [Chlorobium sp.]